MVSINKILSVNLKAPLQTITGQRGPREVWAPAPAFPRRVLGRWRQKPPSLHDKGGVRPHLAMPSLTLKDWTKVQSRMRMV